MARESKAIVKRLWLESPMQVCNYYRVIQIALSCSVMLICYLSLPKLPWKVEHRTTYRWLLLFGAVKWDTRKWLCCCWDNFHVCTNKEVSTHHMLGIYPTSHVLSTFVEHLQNNCIWSATFEVWLEAFRRD